MSDERCVDARSPPKGMIERFKKNFYTLKVHILF